MFKYIDAACMYYVASWLVRREGYKEGFNCLYTTSTWAITYHLQTTTLGLLVVGWWEWEWCFVQSPLSGMGAGCGEGGRFSNYPIY